jgi:hypothetical protein
MTMAMGRRHIEGLYRWPYEVLPLNRMMINICVKDESWQQFRRTLRGYPTQLKLGLLSQYVTELGDLRDVKKDIGSPLWIEQRRRQWRVQNYLNALKRGGFLNDNLEVVR